MSKSTVKKEVKILAIDLAKSSFQLHGVDEDGQVILRKKLTRAKLAPFMANLPLCRIVMEACGGSHHWVRVFTEMGHEAHMIAPQFVKPFVKSNKTTWWMQRPFVRPHNGQICAMFPTRVLNNRISRVFIECAARLSVTELH